MTSKVKDQEGFDQRKTSRVDNDQRGLINT